MVATSTTHEERITGQLEKRERHTFHFVFHLCQMRESALLHLALHGRPQRLDVLAFGGDRAD